MKKGELTLNYLILAALGLIVLIIVAIIFHEAMADFVVRIKEVLSQIWSMKPSQLSPPS